MLTSNQHNEPRADFHKRHAISVLLNMRTELLLPPQQCFSHLIVKSQVPPLLMRYILQDVLVLFTPRREGQRCETILTVIGSLIVAFDQPEANTARTFRHLSFADTL